MNDIEYKYFSEVAKTLNVSEAAKNLYISQPALSHCISKLEKEFNTKLFHHNKNNIILTEAGQTLLNEYPKIILANYQLKQAMISTSKGKDNLYIAIQNGHIFNEDLKKLFSDFEKQYPNIHVNYINISYNTIFDYLLNDIVDIVIAFDNNSTFNDLTKITLLSLENYIIVGNDHPILKCNTYEEQIAYLSNTTLLSVDNSIMPMVNKIIFECCNINNICPKEIKYIKNHSTLSTNLIMNKGFTIFYKNALINNNLIHYLPLKNKMLSSICAYAKTNTNNENIIEFINYIKEYKK